jgi:hypothetical protein
MCARWVIEQIDIVEHFVPSFNASFVGPAPHTLPIEHVEEALRIIIVLPVPAAAHPMFPVVMLQE